MKTIKKIFKFLALLLLIPILYVAVTLIHGTVSDFQPEEVTSLSIDGKAKSEVIQDSVLSFVTWNVGYGGLGEESNFFYDNGGFLTSNGKMVRTSQENVEKNIAGVLDFFKQHADIDFFLLQEIDKDSKRSYHINQYQTYKKALPHYSSTYAVNYRSARVPLPVLEPWNVMGQMEGGLGTYSKYEMTSATRYQLPGEYPWPDRIFQLDRCAAFHSYPLANGKKLIVVNVHNSAYDKGGVLKQQQMDYLKGKLKKLYTAGNYIVVGGDWNQRPSQANPQLFGGEVLKDKQGKIIPKNYLKNWNWVYDADTPTNRALVNVYKKGETSVNLIDFFLTSPNLQIDTVYTVEMDFQFSDHQPVVMKARLQ